METFLTTINQQFHDSPDKILWNSLHLMYSLGDMVHILYAYLVNVKDPFLNEEIFTNTTIKQGLRYIINKLFIIYGGVISEPNIDLAKIIMEECHMDSGIITV